MVNFVKSLLRRIFTYLFNFNTGYFLNPVYYTFNGQVEQSFVICRGYRFFGIPGYDKVKYCIDIEEVNQICKQYGISV